MEEILIEEFNYPLPDERIAKYPLANRDQSKLLVYRDGQVSEDQFFHIGEYLAPGSLLIYNNTRVIQARLVFHKKVVSEYRGTIEHSEPLNSEATLGARIEIFCLEPLAPHDYQLSLGSTEGCTWKCMIGNAKKWKSGALSLPVQLPSGETITLFAERGEQTGNTFAVHFSWNSPLKGEWKGSFAEILDAVGELPIPHTSTVRRRKATKPPTKRSIRASKVQSQHLQQVCTSRITSSMAYAKRAYRPPKSPCT